MPKLDERLKSVAREIRAPIHADIGSDHGLLLASLITSGRIQKGIAIENHRQPYLNSVAALKGLAGEVRFGDGLAVLSPDEANSLSICGMGPDSMRRILESFPDRIPPAIVLQPNRKPEVIRDWAFHNGYHLVNEMMIRRRVTYTIMAFKRASPSADDSENRDPAYQGVNHEAAILFGPLLLKRHDPLTIEQIREEEGYWSQFKQLEPIRQKRLDLLRKLTP